MRQFILPDDFSGQSSFTLTGDSFHYLCHVLRKKEGDQFPGLDKRGYLWSVTIDSIIENKCLLSLVLMDESRKESTAFTLLQCLPKGKKMDLVIRQAVEAGIGRIIPVTSDHAVPRFDNEKDKKKKKERWEKIAVEAMQQSGSSIIPVIEDPVPMDKAADFMKVGGIGLFCHQERIDDNSLHQYLNETPEDVFIVIGPEGGLSEREVKLLSKKEFKPVYLGDNVLRTETAALFATAAVKVLLLEKDKWSLKK